MVTSEWPSDEIPERAPFLVQQVLSLKAAGVKVDVFPFQGNMNPFSYLREWLRFRRSYDFNKYDLVHVQFGQSSLVALPSRVPVVITYHGSDLQGIVNQKGAYRFIGKVLSWWSKFVSRFGDKVILVSSHLNKYLPAEIEAEIIPCGIDLEQFKPANKNKSRNQLKLPTDKYVVLFGANPSRPEKRFNLAQSTVGLLKRDYDIELIWMSGVKYELVPVFMNACDALLFTSMQEGSPMVIKEALACNLPIVSVDVGDVRSRIMDVEGCFISEDDSPILLAEALERVLISNQPIRGREAVTQLDNTIIARKILDVYESVISN